jgi:cellulose biosynthesis protein BcsQ
MVAVALVNDTGGTVKTTSAVSLAGEGRRVLLADLDAHGSASLSLGLSRADLSPGTAEVILDGRPTCDKTREGVSA